VIEITISILALYLYLSLFVIIAISIYGIVVKKNIIKKIIALTILGDTVNTLLILIGYRFHPSPKPPVIPTLKPSIDFLKIFINQSVDPIPQALVITAIVINLAITAFLVFIAIWFYNHYKTIEFGSKRSRGEEV